MNLLNTIKERRSTHTFKWENVHSHILKEIFTYGSYAPTHYMTEAWRIKLYQSKGKVVLINSIIQSYQRIGLIKQDKDPKTLQMIESMKDFLLAIPHHAVIYFEKPDDSIRYEEEFASVSAFIQNSQLAAWQYGVGMLWTIAPYMHDPQFLTDINLDSEKMKIVGVMQIGYPEKVSRFKDRTPIEQKLEIIDE